MAFLQQLRLLLWKNGLSVIRQPVWSLTLIIWPLIIFIIVAVTRNQFPPILSETCYVGPRNLPSTGFFPFLQTLMCNTDSSCHNKSQLLESAASKPQKTKKTKATSRSSLLAELVQGGNAFGFTFPEIEKSNDPAAVIQAFKRILGQPPQGSPKNISFTNTTLLVDQESFNKMLESVSVLKRAACAVILPMVNTTSPDPLTTCVVTFCKTNYTALEVSLYTLNQVLSELVQTKPNEMMAAAGLAVMLVNQLQNQTSLWESLLVLPRLFSNGSVDQGLRDTEALLTSVQGTLHFIQKNLPNTTATLSTVNLVFAGAINVIRYIQNWPGKVVSISLGDVVTLQNDSMSEMVRRVLQGVTVPLDQAVGLTMDRTLVYSHVCNNSSSKPMWLTAACSTGTVNTLLRRISPDKVAKQVLLAWSKHVAPHDVSFVKGLLHSLIGGLSPGGPGGSNTTRTRRSVKTQPQNIDQELFLGLGQVVMELVQLVPELDMVVQSFLRTGFQSMMTATMALDTVEEMMDSIRKDANQFKRTFTTLPSNQWLGRVLGTVMDVAVKALTSANLTCADVLGPLEFLLDAETIKIDVWRAVICQNTSDLQLSLLKGWLPLIQKAQDVYGAITSQTDANNVTLPMILSEWQKLNNKSAAFAEFLNRLAVELGGAYWMNWMPNNTHNLTQTLQQRVFIFMVNWGKTFERSQLWPEVKNYFHMLYWVLSYSPGVTPSPANCSVNRLTLAINCDTGLNWARFVQGMSEALMSSDLGVLVNCLKGTLHLLQHMFGDLYKHLATSSLKNQIKGGDALSDYLVNLMMNLDSFLRVVSTLPNSSTSDPNVMLPKLKILLRSTGLAPMLPLFLGDGPLNFSAVLDVASKVGRLNQHIFTFNETDPTMPELERLITMFLSLQGDLTLSLTHIMANSLLTYSDYFDPVVVARLRKAIEPFTNQTSSGIVEAVLSAMEILKTVTDSPNGDPTKIILGYIRQLQGLVISIYRLRRIEHSSAQVTDLQLLSKDFLNLLTPEGLQNLTQAGPDAAQNIVIQKFVAFLPPASRQEATRFLRDFKALQYYMTKCAAGQDCLAGISEILKFVDQIFDLMLSANGTVTIKLAVTNASLVAQEYEEVTTFVFSLLLGSNDSAVVKTVRQTLHLIRLLVATPNITVSDVQNALRQSNLTLKELDNFSALAGAADINSLLFSITEIINTRQCFEPKQDLTVTAQCVTGLVKGLSRFLTRIPGLGSQTAVLSLIPLIVNTTLRDITQLNFSSNPNMVLSHSLSRTLANVKLSLQANHLNSTEIMKEIRVVERLIQLTANMEPFNNLNTTLMMDPMYAQKVTLEIIDWYLKKLENITSKSNVSEILQPFFLITQMQISLQLAQTDFSLSTATQVEHLIKSLQFPINGTGVSKIGLATVEILTDLFDLIKFNIEAQNKMMAPAVLCNSTVLNAIEAQIKLYLNLTQDWMKQPNVKLIFTSMLQWGNTSMNISTPVTDIQHLLNTMSIFLSEGEVIYLSAIVNIMRSLEKALMVAERPGDLQGDQFVAAIMAGVKTTMALLIGATGPLPHSVQQDILVIVQDSLKLFLQPDMNFDSSRNVSVHILKRAERVVNNTIPEMYAVYLLPAIKVGATFFESASAASGPDVWNQMILSVLKTIESLLPPNSTARASISAAINIAGSVLQSGRGRSASPGGLQSDPLVAAIMAGVETTLALPIGATGPLPHSVQQDILGIVQDSLKLFLQPDMNFDSSRNVSVHILKRAERVVNNTIPEMYAVYLLPAIKVGATFFESASAASGPDVWNQMILSVLKTIESLLPPNSTARASISAVINIAGSVLQSGRGRSASPGGLQSDPLVAAIMAGVETTLALPIGATGPLPHSVQQDILGIVQDSLKLFLQPDMNFDSSRNVSVHILKRAERVVNNTIPEMYAVYLLPAIKVGATFFESASAASGPDVWNQMILSVLKTIESLLPPNSTTRASISVVINITGSILQSGRGNMSLWARLERASLNDVPMLNGELGKLVSMLFVGAPDLQQLIGSSIGVFTQLSPFLDQLMSGKADQDTLEKMLQALLSSLEGTELWHNISSVVPLFEKISGSLVNSIQEENALLLSLQTPLAALMSEVARSVNSSRFNLSAVTERIPAAIEHTVRAAQQANGTLGCSEALRALEPIRQAAGLSPATMALWCKISLQPVLDAYAAAMNLSPHINMTHTGVGPTSVNATAARIAESMQALYHVIVNQSLVTEQLISAFSKQLSRLAGQPLSPEAQLQWNRQLQDVQLQNSLSSIAMLTDELAKAAPSLRPYIEALEKAMSHFVINSPLLPNGSISLDLLKQTATIFLTSANITTLDIFSVMSGNFSGLVEASIFRAMTEFVKLLTDLKALGSDPAVYRALERILACNDTALIVRKVVDMTTWLGSTRASGLGLLMQVLHRMYDILRSVLALLTKLGVQMPGNSELFEDLAGNVLAMLKQLSSTPGLLPPMRRQQGTSMSGSNHSTRVRHRRAAPMMPTRDPMDDFIDLFSIDYPSMFKAISVPPTAGEVLETAHMFFANPDLSVVLKGVTRDMPWGLNASREETISAALGGLSFFTLPSAFQMSSMDLLASAVDMLPDAIPFSPMFKIITRALANESVEILMLMQQTIGTAAELFQSNVTDQQLKEKLALLRSQVCALENTTTVHQLLWFLPMERGQLCRTVLPSLQILAESLLINASVLTDAVFQSLVGEPKTYSVQSSWTSVLGQGLDFNTSSLSSLNINVTAPGVVTVGELLRDKAAFVQDVQRHVRLDPAALSLLTAAVVPNNNLAILSWLVNLRQCISSVDMKASDAAILKAFCSMSVEQWYSFSLLMVRHVNLEKLIYRVVLSEDMQSLVVAMLQIAETLTDMMNTILPTVSKLQSYLLSIQDLNLMADNNFNLMSRGLKSSISGKATFVTLSRALCSNGIMALFGISKLPPMMEQSPTFPSGQWREEMIDRFKIPRNATPFCMNMYLDMVNTTGGAIAWAFLKPMLMGQVLYTPDTPITRAIMEKANATLQEFANLRKNSQEWIQSSNYIINSAELLGNTLPMLQNSLSNSFVKNFIEMQTDIDVDRMKETLSSFSNMTVMLEKNKLILNQITTLSTLMVDLSSCIKFDRYRGYDSAEQLDNEAQELAKNRNLYASVIFKLPKGDDSTKNPRARSSSNASSLPPQVSYTIRMHMDNVMRTDRVRDPFFVKDPHILARQTMRYNRGFVYLQENIDRAIIQSQTGKRVAEPAVQLQPFPYPCHLRDEYLEAISFVFPLMLMLAWVLFVADFVKKLVHERELRLHEYMKMMGVNPLSHFFAWFVECATYLVLTIIILTLLLKYGKILPNSDGFLLFCYLCNYGLSIIAFSYMVSSFFDKTFIAGLSGSLLYILSFFPFIVVMAVETGLTFSQKSALSLFSPTCFGYASQYVSRYESQGEGIHWSNMYTSPIAGDTASFGWLNWLMLIDTILYFVIGAYIRRVFPGKYGIPSPWYFPFKASFWANLCCCIKSKAQAGKGLLFTNIMQKKQPVFPDDKEKDKSALSFKAGEDLSELPVGVALHGLSKMYGDRVAIQNLNVSFHEGHVTSLLGHNGAGKTTTMSLLTGLFAPTSGTIEVYGRDMQTNIDDIRKELGVCMQYDVLFDHMTTKEHLMLYGQIKAPHWSRGELREQVRTTLEETGMYIHRHKRVGALSGGMKRKLSISIAFIGGSRLVVLDEPTTGVDPCSRRSIWDIVIQHKKNRTIIMSTHHLDEAEVLSDRIAFLERGGLKCCGSPFHLKDKLGQGYKLTLTKKLQNRGSEAIDSAELKQFIQAHVPRARLREAQGGDLVYSLPPFTSANASSYRSLLTALDANLDALQLGGYGISDTTLEEVFLQLTHDSTEAESVPLSISETISDTGSVDSFPSYNGESLGDEIKLTSSSMVSGMALAWQQISAMLLKRFHHSRRDWKGLIAQILLPVLFVIFAMGMGSVKSDLRHYPELELSPALYNIGPSYSFFRNQNPSSAKLVDSMMSFPGMDNACLDKPDNPVCAQNTYKWSSRGNGSEGFSICKCTSQEQVCAEDNYQPPHRRIPSSQVVSNLSGFNVENYLVATANDFIRNRYGGFDFGLQLPTDLQLDLRAVPRNRTLSKVWFNPEGHHTMPAYLNSLSNLILRSNLPADKDPREYAISVSSHPYFGRADDEDTIIQGMLQILVAMCVLAGYSITTASFAIYEVHEHHSGSKRLQHIAGIGEPFYWAVNFLFDMIIYLIPVTLSICVIAAFQVPAFTARQNLGAVALLLVLFGFSTFPWMYLLSGVFKDPEMAFITYVCINLFISINTIMSTSILYFLSQISMRNPELIKIIFERLSYAFLIFPQFNFGNGLMQLARKNIEVQILSGYGIDAYQNPFSTDALGWMFISSFIQGVVFFTLRLLLNKFLLQKVRHLICGRKTMPAVACEDEDEDVAAEKLRVSSGAADGDLLQVDQLTKSYQHFKRKIHAVKRLSVGIPAGECFGLLGVNGAGKTTTFKMLTGDVRPTDGTAQIRDWDGRLVDIMECRSQGINIGYCPQEDALDGLLTGEEHLHFYARIRGIPERDRESVVNYLLKRLELSYHRHIITDGYSCGTRRKLSTALALIGHPQILLLDEPSSGMDPRSKRHLWKIISEEVKGKCAVVLTSHSMEECEALCSRLAIMDKGQFRCLGSLQHIKNRFGSGFTVKMYLAEASCDVEAITGFMQQRFPSTYLKDQHSTMVEYHVPVAPGGVADIFDQLESNKNALQIKHFSVSQTTLDEVFINFAMGKIGMETIPIDSKEEECDDLDSEKAVDA